MYLLRSVEAPRSVDPLVWPRIPVPAHLVREWTGPNADLWDDLEALEALRVELSPAQSSLVAITCDACAGHFEAIDHLPPTSRRWRFLGFDVADGSLLSALMNCGYLDPAEALGMRSRWASHLNGFHLFEDQAAANEFKQVSERRVPEHCPFFVCGLWEQVSSEDSQR